MSGDLTRGDIAEPPAWGSTLAKFDAHSITDADGWSLGVDTSGVDLAIGTDVLYWGRGLGYSVRGLAVGHHVFWYRTEHEQAANEQAERENREAQQKAEFDAQREAHDRRYDELPDAFKARVDRFRAANPDFRWQFEAYEVMCCRDALKIASYCSVNRLADVADGQEPTAADNVLAFQRLPWDEQKAAGIDPGHSGNSFGFACRLAYLWVTDPGRVEFEHGALVPLVGCKAYGCTHEVHP